MAITADQLAAHIARYGPWAFHVVSAKGWGSSDVRIGQILRDGLAPRSAGHGEAGGMGSGGSGPIRNGHVYLLVPAHANLTEQHLPEVAGAAAHIRVDLRQLDPARFDLDEDSLALPGLRHLNWSTNRPDADAPEHVALSMQNGSFAYRGAIAPELLELNPFYVHASELSESIAALPSVSPLGQEPANVSAPLPASTPPR